MRVLVTGLDGFTGSHLKYNLQQQGHVVVGLTSDLTDADAVATEIAQLAPDAVAHLAAIAFVAHGNANAFYEVNLIGTRNLLAALAEHAPDVGSILLASSANVYGNRAEGVLNENIVPFPVNDYAVSKLAMEQMATLWQDRLPIFIVRPFNYTGVGQDEKFLIPKVVSHFRENKSVIELGNLDVWREFGDVRNVADIYRQLLELAPVGKVLNICTGKAHSLREVVKMCKKITGNSIDIQVNPTFVRANEVRVLTGDNRCLKDLVGDSGNLYKLEDTLQWMLQDDS